MSSYWELTNGDDVSAIKRRFHVMMSWDINKLLNNQNKYTSHIDVEQAVNIDTSTVYYIVRLICS